MRKKIASLFVTGLCAALIAGCGAGKDATKGGTDANMGASATSLKPTEQASTAATEASSVEEVNTFEVPEGMYLSELTGEPIDEALKDQRPIAVMVDNEKTALKHYGTSEADIVYELMNSTANDRITRLMCIFKDWGSIDQLGSIRSTRPTNIALAAEFNAVLCHDGGPYYNDSYFDGSNPVFGSGIPKDLCKDHFSGGFTRINNGKSREFTEYICKGDLESRFQSSGISTTYNDNRFEDGEKFNFVNYGQTVDMASVSDTVQDVNEVVLPFKHNGSTLKYNAETEKYEYWEYGEQHLDGEDDAPLTFDNVILQDTTFSQLDEHGYLVYNYLGQGEGYYLTKGQCIKIYWIKGTLNALTYYFTDSEYTQELQLNTGKTYVSLVPDDTWSQVQLNK